MPLAGYIWNPAEIFVSDGAKSDTYGNIGDILRHDNSIGVTDPIYPVYIDSNVMCGRAGVLETEDGAMWSICPAWVKTISFPLSPTAE